MAERLQGVERIAAVAVYPGVMAFGCIGYVLLQRAGLSLQLSAYLAVAAAVGAIALYELRFPYRKNWRAGRREIVNDALFLGLVQMALPKFLSLAAVLALAGFAGERGWGGLPLWPHGAPVVVQVVLMVLLADFLRYWLHRACHTDWRLWRFHAVHHSPKLLYWLNVGRFHPFEKAAQFLLDALPFILIGVSEPVLAGYFVFYAINGFFQHSNCLVRLGPLNWVISGPELHRWHHSKESRESNANYGNNLIVWDVLFGTRFLPADREVDELGLYNRNYPEDFASQMRTPFVRGLDKA